MRKLMTALALVLMVAATLVVGAGSAGADGHNKNSCETSGGTWTNGPGGHKSCVYPEVTEDGKNDNFSCTTQETTEGHGNLDNRTDSSTEQTDSEGTGSGKCPPGQFS
jgi:hypothetical protein